MGMTASDHSITSYNSTNATTISTTATATEIVDTPCYFFRSSGDERFAAKI
jgi:hypothetical protein